MPLFYLPPCLKIFRAEWIFFRAEKISFRAKKNPFGAEIFWPRPGLENHRAGAVAVDTLRRIWYSAFRN
jgi:hypothetical protein